MSGYFGQRCPRGKKRAVRMAYEQLRPEPSDHPDYDESLREYEMRKRLESLELKVIDAFRRLHALEHPPTSGAQYDPDLGSQDDRTVDRNAVK